MSPMSRQSSGAFQLLKVSLGNRNRSWLFIITILLGCFIPAIAQTHITVSTTLPAATASQAYNANIVISGGSAPFQFVVDRGALPAG